MRKTGLFTAIVFLLALLFAGCSLGGTSPTPEDPVEETPGSGGGEFSEFPEPVADTLKIVRQIQAGTTVVHEDQTFIIVSYGEQPTAGYEVDIAGIETEGERAVVTVELTEPEGPAAEVITYPYAVEVLNGVYTDVQFQDARGEYFPQVVGLDKPLELIARSNNILVGAFGATDQIYAAGLARVFEATVSYELQDARGNVLQNGCTMAASGGPDWGYFEITIDDPPTDCATLVIYQASMKDGSKMDVVELPVVSSRG